MGFDERLKQWILQLRASPACRMTWGWGERLEQKPVHLSVLLQTVQNELPLFFLKETNLLKINLLRISAKPVQTTSIQYQCLQHQPNTNAHNINPKSMHIATDFLLVGFSSLKTFTLRSMPLTCHSARSRRRSRRIHQHRGIKYYLDSPLSKKPG